MKGHGGSRFGAGRKPGKVKPETKVIRIDKNLADFIQRGKMDELAFVLNDWIAEVEEASLTSPRWHKVREMTSQVQDCIGENEFFK